MNVIRPDQNTFSRSRLAAQPIKRSKQQTVFGPFCIDPQNATLTRGDEPISMTPKAFAVLCYLVDSASRLATRDAIFEQAWPRSVVTDSALTVCIREIRTALGDDPKSPCYIETVRKRGFRFICETSSPPSTCPNTLQASTTTQVDRLIVGRDKALGILQQCLDKALTGVRQLAFVTGDWENYGTRSVPKLPSSGSRYLDCQRAVHRELRRRRSLFSAFGRARWTSPARRF